MRASASFRVRNAWREVPSHNVIARIEGSDPLLKDEVVVYTAHWDHFGWDKTLPGPKAMQVYHGARDNASGIASLLSLANINIDGINVWGPTHDVVIIGIGQSSLDEIVTEVAATQDGWDLSGAVADLRLSFQVGLRVAEGARFPEWRADSEFKARRDAMLGSGYQPPVRTQLSSIGMRSTPQKASPSTMK